jgi:hypothetical protein
VPRFRSTKSSDVGAYGVPDESPVLRGITGYSAQVLRFEADTRTGRGIRNCFILSLFGLTASPIAR